MFEKGHVSRRDFIRTAAAASAAALGGAALPGCPSTVVLGPRQSYAIAAARAVFTAQPETGYRRYEIVLESVASSVAWRDEASTPPQGLTCLCAYAREVWPRIDPARTPSAVITGESAEGEAAGYQLAVESFSYDESRSRVTLDATLGVRLWEDDADAETAGDQPPESLALKDVVVTMVSVDIDEEDPSHLYVQHGTGAIVAEDSITLEGAPEDAAWIHNGPEGLGGLRDADALFDGYFAGAGPEGVRAWVYGRTASGAPYVAAFRVTSATYNAATDQTVFASALEGGSKAAATLDAAMVHIDAGRSTGAGTLDDYLFTRDHMWLKPDGAVWRLGITAYAAGELGHIVFVDLPETGTAVERDDQLLLLEAVKVISDVYAPRTGTVTAINHALYDFPSEINDDPYGQGYLLDMHVANPDDREGLMDYAAYQAYCDVEDAKRRRNGAYE